MSTDQSGASILVGRISAGFRSISSRLRAQRCETTGPLHLNFVRNDQAIALTMGRDEAEGRIYRRSVSTTIVSPLLLQKWQELTIPV